MDFRPAALIRHGHAQTIWPALFRRTRPRRISAEIWDLPDGERLDVELLPHRPGQPGVLVLHGLEGSSRARYVRGLLAAIEARGWNGAAFSFRSCGPTPLRGDRLYHSGDTRDLPVVIERLVARWPESKLGAVGFSMGGNVLLKWLGEHGDAAALAGAVAVSVPFDLGACATALDGPGLFPALYRRRFLRTLRRKALVLARRVPALDAAAIASCDTFGAFDERVTAPLFGFASAADYWQRSSSVGFLAAIRRPTLIVSAEDDPMVPPHTLPRDALAANPLIEAHITPRGGHVGFVGGSLLRPRYHVDALALAFLATRLA